MGIGPDLGDLRGRYTAVAMAGRVLQGAREQCVRQLPNAYAADDLEPGHGQLSRYGPQHSEQSERELRPRDQAAFHRWPVHAQSGWNRAGRWAGRADTDLYAGHR